MAPIGCDHCDRYVEFDYFEDSPPPPEMMRNGHIHLQSSIVVVVVVVVVAEDIHSTRDLNSNLMFFHTPSKEVLQSEMMTLTLTLTLKKVVVVVVVVEVGHVMMTSAVED
jgi:hypothetical protein